MGITYSEHGRNKKSIQIFKQKTQGKRQLGRGECRCEITLKWNLEKEVMKV
jgi:hypothetical protein